jgi:hypothetical protein
VTRTAIAAPPPPGDDAPTLTQAIKFLRDWERDPAAVLLMRGPRAQEILARHVRVLLDFTERRARAFTDE